MSNMRIVKKGILIMKKYILLSLAIITVFSLTACNNGNDSNNINTVEVVTSEEDMTGYPTGNVQVRCVMINDKLYGDVNDHFDEIPDHFTNRHTIEAVDDYSFPEQNLHGANINVGDVFYSSDKIDLCVYYFDGEKYTQFKEMK